jgi:Ca2+/Na+ antiporter
MLSLIAMLLLYHFVWVDPTSTLTTFFVMMVFGVHAVSSSRLQAVIASVIGAVAFTLLLLAFAHPSFTLSWGATAFFIAYFGYMVVIVLIYVVRGGKVTRDKIFGAISVYFLIVYLWAFVYRFCFILDPLSFTGNKPLAAGALHVDFIFYSFGTITTLGFNDIKAVSDFARSLSMLETVTGNFYIAVLISRLVSAYSSAAEV